MCSTDKQGLLYDTTITYLGVFIIYLDYIY